MNDSNTVLAASVDSARKAALAAQPNAEILIREVAELAAQHLGGLERNLGALAQPSLARQTDAQQQRVLEDALTRFEDIARGVFYPPQAPAPALSPEHVAAGVIAQAQAAGVKLSAFPDGRLEASPASGVSDALRASLTLFREPIVAALRRDVLVVPSATPPA